MIHDATDVDDDGTGCEDENDEIDQTEHIFEFITVPSFLSLYSGNSIDPLYFVHVTGKGVAEEDMPDPYGHFVQKGERYFQGLYLKLVRSRNAKVKRFSTLPTKIILTPDEIYDSYVDFNEHLELDTSVYNTLIQKASC